MSGGVKRLLELLAVHWPLVVPRAHLRAEVGDEVVEWLERERVAIRVPVEVGRPYPCPHATRLGCARKVIEHDGLVALCRARPVACADERIAEEDAVWLHVGVHGFVPALQRALGLDVRPVPDGGSIVLGVRHVGRRLAEFVLVPNRTSALARAADPERFRVIVTFGELPGEGEAASAMWLPLVSTWDPLVTKRIDLGEEPVDVAAAVATGRYTFAVEDGTERIWFRSEQLDLEARPREKALLLALLRQPGRWVTRDELMAELWPGDMGRKGIDPSTLAARLRRLKSRLLERVGDPKLIQSQTGRDEADCGLRLGVHPGRVWWRREVMASHGVTP